MHKLIVYGNGVTNPTITIPHGMFKYHEVKMKYIYIHIKGLWSASAIFYAIGIIEIGR